MAMDFYEAVAQCYSRVGYSPSLLIWFAVRIEQSCMLSRKCCAYNDNNNYKFNEYVQLFMWTSLDCSTLQYLKLVTIHLLNKHVRRNSLNRDFTVTNLPNVTACSWKIKSCISTACIGYRKLLWCITRVYYEINLVKMIDTIINFIFYSNVVPILLFN